MLGRIPRISDQEAAATRQVVAARAARGRAQERSALARALRDAVAAGRVDADTARAALADGDIDRVAALVADVTGAIYRQFRPLPNPLDADGSARERARSYAIPTSAFGRWSIQRWLREAHRLGLLSRASIERALARGGSRVHTLADASARRFWRAVFADMPDAVRNGMPWFVTAEFHFDDDGWHLLGTTPLTAIPVASVMTLPDGLGRAVRSAFDALSLFGLPFQSFGDWELSLETDGMVEEALAYASDYRAQKGASLAAEDYEALSHEVGVDPCMLEVLDTLSQSGWGFPRSLYEFDQVIRGEITAATVVDRLRGAARAYRGWRWAHWIERVADAIEWFDQQPFEPMEPSGDGPVDLVGCALQPGVCPEFEDHHLEMLHEHAMQAPGVGLLEQPSLAALRTYFGGLAWVLGLLREAAHIETQEEEVHANAGFIERDAA